MNKEIKEILECLEKYGQLTPDAIDDLHYIRDYITNLQEENERLKNALCSDNIVSKNKYNHLKKIKESLELEISTIKDFQGLYIDYKSRINVALRIIEEKRGYYDIPDELEKVLKGSDKE